MNRRFTLQELPLVAGELLAAFPEARCFAFRAEMGSGKTTFISALCRVLGVEDTVSSPTFSIINEYRTAGGEAVFHMDWYRLRHAEDAFEAGVQDLLARHDAICLIEWPDIAPELLPTGTVWVSLQVVDEQTRVLQAGVEPASA